MSGQNEEWSDNANDNIGNEAIGDEGDPENPENDDGEPEFNDEGEPEFNDEGDGEGDEEGDEEDEFIDDYDEGDEDDVGANNFNTAYDYTEYYRNVDGYHNRIWNGRHVPTPYDLNEEYTESENERVYNNFTPQVPKNHSSLTYPWSMIQTQYTFTRIPNKDSVDIAPPTENIKRIYATYNKKMEARNNIINGRNITKVHTIGDPQLKIPQQEVEDLDRRIKSMVDSLKQEQQIDIDTNKVITNGEGIRSEKMRAFTIDNKDEDVFIDDTIFNNE